VAEAERWAADIAGPAGAIDDQTAIQVIDGTVEVVSEGQWKVFPRSRARGPRRLACNHVEWFAVGPS
jgi:hypothetical protein